MPCALQECADHHLKIAARKLGLPSDLDVIAQKIASQIATPPPLKLVGTVITLVLMAKLKLVPATQFKTECEASLMYGKLKQAGTRRDAATIRRLIPNAKSLIDQELINLWGTNEHNEQEQSFHGCAHHVDLQLA